MSTAAPESFRVTFARLDCDAPRAGDSGRVLVKATVDTTAIGGNVESALLTNAATVSVRDANQFNATVALTGCQRAGRSVRCKSSGVLAKLQQTSTPSIYRFRLSLSRLTSARTGTAQPRERAQVTIQLPGSIDLIDVISDCAPIGQLRLNCVDRNRPNIVFIVSDDQRWDTLQYMPRTLDRLASHGVTFTNAFVTTPLCGPSRASMLTGEYARHHGVLDNTASSGSASAFVGADASTLATWLHSAGYRTGMYGKYFVGYAAQCPPYRTSCYRPPGWDEWHVFWTQRYYDYTLDENGVDVAYGATAADYSTDVITAKSVEFIESAHGQPFFLHIGFHAPHQEGGGAPIPAPRHVNTYADIPPWRPPSYDEEDISDKPPWLASLPRADTPFGAFFTYGLWGDYVRTSELQTLAAVDEGVDALFAALDAAGQADNTVFVFISDNGYLWGEHRYFYGKSIPEEESIRVPLIIRYPRLIVSSRTESRLALNIDLAPTLARLAGVEPPSFVDGASLEPLLAGTPASWRDDFVIEWWAPLGVTGQPTYAGIRTADQKYVVYPSAPDAELYDLVNDPYELDNRAHDPAYQSTAASLQARLDALLSQ